jgi:hypothetical protein
MNMRFTKRFESAKKRTELLSLILDGMAVLRAKKEQLLSVKDLCHACPKSRAEQICSSFENLIQKLGHKYEEIEGMIKITDPIKIEHILAKQEKLDRDVSDFVTGIDAFIKNCQECEEPRRVIFSDESKKKIDKVYIVIYIIGEVHHANSQIIPERPKSGG